MSKCLSPMDYFRMLSLIPRCSGNEKAAADFVEKIAINHGCSVYRDKMHNMIVTKQASSNCYKNAPPFMIQGHLDMVGEAVPGNMHNFETDPITIVEKDGIIHADGTTLGADDGIAVALMLSVLTDDNLVHPDLECVFTVQEETGLYGAMALDASRLKSRIMLNLDAGPEGVFIVSCSGGCHIRLVRRAVWEQSTLPGWKLSISGLEGGHSGSAISRQGGNALVIMGMLLEALYNLTGRIGAFCAGDKDNVIPKSAAVEFAFQGDPSKILEPLTQKIKLIYASSDPNLNISWERAPVPRVLSTDDAKALTELLCLLPHGVIRYSNEMSGLPETSSNLAAVKTGDYVELHLSLRSSSDFCKQLLINRVKMLAKQYGASCEFDGIYPGWAYSTESQLRHIAVNAFEKVYGYSPQIQGIHSGLECGVLKGKIPDLDIIATGPKYGGMHTPDEWLEVESLNRTYEFVKELIRIIAEQ